MKKRGFIILSPTILITSFSFGALSIVMQFIRSNYPKYIPWYICVVDCCYLWTIHCQIRHSTHDWIIEARLNNTFDFACTAQRKVICGMAGAWGKSLRKTLPFNRLWFFIRHLDASPSKYCVYFLKFWWNGFKNHHQSHLRHSIILAPSPVWMARFVSMLVILEILLLLRLMFFPSIF